MRKHKDRKHAQWSASSTARNWLCPGNLAISEDIVRAPESKAAAWGTACHEVSERLLRLDVPIDIGDEITTDRHIFHIDQEMMDCAYVYVDYIRDRMKNGYDLVAVEKEFSLKSLGLPMDVGGTADAVLYSPKLKRLEIVDLKTGRGNYVEAIGNPQERFYALGVLVSLDLRSMPVTTIETTIVQPRFPMKDGSVIRSETLHLADLMDWTIDLDPRVRKAAEAIKLYATARVNSAYMDDWVDEFLVPGEEQCHFCPAAGGCPALRKRALEIAGAWQDDSGIHFKSNIFAENTVEAVEADLDLIEHMEGWIRERRSLAHEMATQGHQFDHYTLVEKVGHRKFDGKNEADIVAKIRNRIPVDDVNLFDTKLKSPAGLEKAIGKKAVENHLADLIIRPVTGTDLIRNTHTGRMPAATVVDLLFGTE
jgi:hypothetical protein